jgi:hypothetical protein
MVRVSKIARAFRVMNFFTELRALLQAITSSIGTLFWCLLTLGIFCYIFAIILVTAVSVFLAAPDRDINTEDLLKYWGSVQNAMLTLYMACTGGEDWGPLAEVLKPIGDIYYVVFLVYIAFVLLAVLNMLTGLFVENALRATERDLEGRAEREMAKEISAVREFVRLFAHIVGFGFSRMDGDEDTSPMRPSLKDCVMSQEMLAWSLAKPKLRAKFAVLGLEIWSAEEFYDLLTSKSTEGTLHLHDFVLRCMELRGSAPRFSVGTIGYTLDRVFSELCSTRCTLESLANLEGVTPEPISERVFRRHVNKTSGKDLGLMSQNVSSMV